VFWRYGSTRRANSGQGSGIPLLTTLISCEKSFSASARFDWRGWRADVVERLDRRSIGAALAWVAILTALTLLGQSASFAAVRTLLNFSTVMVTLAVLAVALVAVARGISPWVAYPAAGFAVFAIGSLLGLVIDPFQWRATTPTPQLHTMIVAYSYFLVFLCPFAVLYVYASRATHDAKVLRALEAERAAEAERLARQRLQTELATVDHDLVLRAMRLALTARASGVAEAPALLEAVTAYLRAAQQRGSSEPERVAAALRELKEACASGRGEAAHGAVA